MQVRQVMAGKKKGKGKKSAVPAGPPIVTTSIIRRERVKVLCPRLGDAFTRAKLVDEILEDVAERILLKASIGRANTINLSCMRINQLPDLFQLAPDLKSLVDINLSRNNLFNSDHVFEVCDCTVLYFIALYYLFCIVLYRLYRIVLYHLYCIELHFILLHCIVLNCTVSDCIVLYTALYCTARLERTHYYYTTLCCSAPSGMLQLSFYK